MLQCDEAGKTLLGMPENYREFSIYQWKRQSRQVVALGKDSRRLGKSTFGIGT